MPEKRYARIVVRKRRDEVIVSGQKQTRKGQYFSKDNVHTKMGAQTGAAFRIAAALGVKELLDNSEPG